MEFSALCVLNSSCPCCSKDMANDLSAARNDVQGDLPAMQDIHHLQFGDVSLDDDTPDTQDGIPPVRDTDAINQILERQAIAIEKLAGGIKDIAQALREIAKALSPRNASPAGPDTDESPNE